MAGGSLEILSGVFVDVDKLLDGSKELLLEATVEGGVVVEVDGGSAVVDADGVVVHVCSAL